MKKKNVFVLVIIVALLTSVATFALTKEFSDPKVVVVEKEVDKTTIGESNSDNNNDIDSNNSDDSNVNISEGHILKDEDYKNYIQLKERYSDFEALIKHTEDNFLYDYNVEEMLIGAKKGMLSALKDPYTLFYSKEEFAKLWEDTEGSFVGIGVYIAPSDDNKILVIAPIEDTPAEKVGIITGDKIVKIDGEEYLGSEIDEAVKHMRGEENTKVIVTVERMNEDKSIEYIDFEILRQKIKAVTVKGSMMEDNIGYIRITTFNLETAKDFKAKYKELKEAGMKSLVLDLRSNGGGIVDSSTEICDMFIDEGYITYTKTKKGEKEFYYANKGKEDIPMVLLVNGGSASASEIMSGAFKDLNIAKLIGTKTFGKGIVQRFQYFGIEGEGLKMTVSEYFTPNDVNIHGIGIEPDIELELNENIEGIGPDFIDQDNQLARGVEELKKMMND